MGLKLLIICLLIVKGLCAAPVVIIGSGPAGIASAIEASLSHKEVLLVEKRKTYTGIRPLFLEEDSLNLLEKWGVKTFSLQIIDCGKLGKKGFIHLNDLEEALNERVNALGIKRLQGEFISLGWDKTIKVDDQNIAYEFVIGADGNHSTLRKELEIEYEVLGKGVGAVILFEKDETSWHFEITKPVYYEGYYLRKCSFGSSSFLFVQTTKKEHLYLEDLIKASRGAQFISEAEMIGKGKSKVLMDIPITIARAKRFSSKSHSALLIGDAAATASFFEDFGVNSAFQEAYLTGCFFKTHDWELFETAMHEVAGSLIQRSGYLFNSKVQTTVEASFQYVD